MFVSDINSLTESSQFATTSNTPNTPKTQRPKSPVKKGGQLSASAEISEGHQLYAGKNRQIAPNKNVGANILIDDIPQSDNNPAIKDMASIARSPYCVVEITFLSVCRIEASH